MNFHKKGNRRAGKYNNHRIKTVHGWFDSKGELSRWLFLLDCEKRGQIEDLRRQVTYPLEVNGEKVCDYVADFVYSKKGFVFVEDFKGMITDVFRLKAKLFRAVYGYDIRVVKSPTAAP